MSARDLAQNNNQQKLKAHQATGDSGRLYRQAVEEIDPEKKIALFNQARQKNKEVMDILKSLPLTKLEVKLALVEAMSNSSRIHEQMLHIRSGQLNAMQVSSLTAMAAVAYIEPGSATSRPFNDDELAELSIHVQTLDEVVAISHQLAEIYRTLLKEQPYASHLSASDKKEYQTGQRLNFARQSMSRLSSAHLRAEMALQQRLRCLTIAPADDTALLLRHFAGNYEKRFYVLLGNLNGVISPLERETAPTGEQKTEVLRSLAAQFGVLASDSEWLTGILKTGGAEEKGIVADVTTLVDCARKMQSVAQDQLAQSMQLAEPQRDADASASFLPPGLKIQSGGRRQGKKTSRQDKTQADAKKQQEQTQGIKQAVTAQPAENPHAIVIDTEFDGKLVGERKGDFVEVADFRGGTIPYQRQGDVWVRHEPDEDMSLSDDMAKTDGRLPPEKTLLALHGRQARINSKVDGLLQESERYQRLASFMDRNEASYKQVSDTFRLAFHKLSTAENHFRRLAAAWTHLGGRHEAIGAACAEEAQGAATRAHDIEVQRRQLKAAQVAAVKQQLLGGDRLDGERLDFLLGEGEVREVHTSIHRKKLAGPKIKGKTAVPEDFMDEHKISLRGENQVLTLHTHYRKKNAPLEEQQSSHLQHTGPDGVQKNGADIPLAVLQRLHGAFPADV